MSAVLCLSACLRVSTAASRGQPPTGTRQDQHLKQARRKGRFGMGRFYAVMMGERPREEYCSFLYCFLCSPPNTKYRRKMFANL